MNVSVRVRWERLLAALRLKGHELAEADDARRAARERPIIAAPEQGDERSER